MTSELNQQQNQQYQPSNWNYAGQQYGYGYPYQPQGWYGYPPPPLPWQLPRMPQDMSQPGPSNAFEQWGRNPSGMGQTGVRAGMSDGREGGGFCGNMNEGRMTGQMGQGHNTCVQNERRMNEGSQMGNLDGNGSENVGSLWKNNCENDMNGNVENDDVDADLAAEKNLVEKRKEIERSVHFADNSLAITVDSENIGERREEVETEVEERSEKVTEGKKEGDMKQCDQTTGPAKPTVTGAGTELEQAVETGTASVNQAVTAQPEQASQPSLPGQDKPSISAESIRPTADSIQASSGGVDPSTSNSAHAADIDKDSLASNSAAQVASAEARKAGEVSNSAERKKVGEEQSGFSQSLTHYFQPIQVPGCGREEGGRGRRESRGGSARLSLGGKGENKAIANKIAGLRVEGKMGGGEKEKSKGQRKEGGNAGAFNTRSKAGKK